MHLMTYDFYGSWNTETGHNAALHKGEGFENVHRDNVFTVDVAVEYWLSQGKASICFISTTVTYISSESNLSTFNSGRLSKETKYN